MPLSPPRLAKAGIFVLLAIAIALPVSLNATGHASAAPENPIVARAKQDIGKWGGQCKAFVQVVVQDALGKKIGFDYHLGYIEAGAIEITLEGAGPGDIIQIADDNYTLADSDYPGLHTFIVSEVLGKGKFNGIDSNSQFDEMVRFREGYDPRAAAGRYPNLGARVYRFVTAESPAPKAGPIAAAPRAKALAPGDQAVVIADGTTLNLRAGPGLTEAVKTQLPDGTVVTVVSAPVPANGHIWLKVKSTYGEGWVASAYLSLKGTQTASGSSNARPLYSYRVLTPGIAVGN